MLINQWLKTQIKSPDGVVNKPSSGSPQGGIISPVLANIYLHYALDLWFEKKVKPRIRGRCMMIRYAGDCVRISVRKFQVEWGLECNFHMSSQLFVSPFFAFNIADFLVNCYLGSLLTFPEGLNQLDWQTHWAIKPILS